MYLSLPFLIFGKPLTNYGENPVEENYETLISWLKGLGVNRASMIEVS